MLDADRAPVEQAARPLWVKEAKGEPTLSLRKTARAQARYHSHKMGSSLVPTSQSEKRGGDMLSLISSAQTGAR